MAEIELRSSNCARCDLDSQRSILNHCLETRIDWGGIPILEWPQPYAYILWLFFLMTATLYLTALALHSITTP